MRIPLIGGAYAARSVIANAQVCLNLFPEKNPKDSPNPVTFYPRPGLRPKTVKTGDPGRGLYQASNGNSYTISGSVVYFVKPDWTLQAIGNLIVPGTSIVKMTDNGVTMVIVDNSNIGYQVDLATNVFSQIMDPSGIFTGATTVDIIDGFVIWNVPGRPTFGSTLDNVIQFDPLYTAAKNNYPGPIITLGVNRHEILLLGKFKSEIWYDAGNPQFPFAELPGSSIEHGAIAPYGLAFEDINAYWLSQNLQGFGFILKQTGYKTSRQSNHALEWAIRKMQQSSGIADCVAGSWQIDGHVFLPFTFPRGDQTWVYDASINDPDQGWHQEGWTDGNGLLHRHRGIAWAVINGLNCCLDWENGTIYQLDPEYFVDTVNGIDYPIVCRRTFPQLQAAMDAQTRQLVVNDGLTMTLMSFVADMDVGEVPLDSAGNEQNVILRVSIDRGKSFTTSQLQSMGTPGAFQTQQNWNRPSNLSRWPIMMLEWSFNGFTALNGGWVEAMWNNK